MEQSNSTETWEDRFDMAMELVGETDLVWIKDAINILSDVDWNYEAALKLAAPKITP